MTLARWIPRFRLRTLLALTAVCGALLAPVALEFGRYRREEATVNRLASRLASRVYIGGNSDLDSFARSRGVSLVDERSGSGRDDFEFNIGRGKAWFGLFHPVVLVHLAGSSLKVDDFLAMAELHSLRSLEVHEAGLTRRDLEAIARLSSLEWLDFWHCRLNCDDLQPLARLQKLKSLQLDYTDVPESAVIELKEALPGLEVLDGFR